MPPIAISAANVSSFISGISGRSSILAREKLRTAFAAPRPVPHPAVADFGGLVRALSRHQVEVIVIGGLAASLHGAPLPTFDLDVIRRVTPQNIERLESLLADLDAVFRHDPGRRRLRPGASHLAAQGALLLNTRLGPLDVLATLHDGRGYDDLLPHTEVIHMGDVDVRVLDLTTLIEVKVAVGREKDKMAAAHLIALLRHRETEEQGDKGGG